MCTCFRRKCMKCGTHCTIHRGFHEHTSHMSTCSMAVGSCSAQLCRLNPFWSHCFTWHERHKHEALYQNNVDGVSILFEQTAGDMFSSSFACEYNRHRMKPWATGTVFFPITRRCMRDPLRTIVRRATNTPQILRQYEADQQNQNKRERTGALSSLKVRTTLCKSSIYGFLTSTTSPCTSRPPRTPRSQLCKWLNQWVCLWQTSSETKVADKNNASKHTCWHIHRLV